MLFIDVPDYNGLTKTDAERMAKMQGYELRVFKDELDYEKITEGDLRSDRVNVELRGGRVQKAFLA